MSKTVNQKHLTELEKQVKRAKQIEKALERKLESFHRLYNLEDK